MSTFETFQLLIQMSDTERKKTVKDLSPEKRADIADMIGLPKKFTQKLLCSDLKEIQILSNMFKTNSKEI